MHMPAAVYQGALAGFAVTSALIAVLIPVATQWSLLDHPNERKTHLAPTPIVGGIAMYLGVLVSFALAGVPWQELGPLAAGSTVLVLVGVIDDIKPLGYRIRFVAQCVGATILILWGGLTIDNLGDLFGLGPLGLGPLAIPFTLVCVVGLINAVNMLDGLDGLAGGVVIAMLMPVLAYTAFTGLTGLAVPTLLVIASVCGFLLFNYRFPWRDRARTFMGDAGSNFLGLVVAWIVLELYHHPQSELPPIAIAWIVALPVVDTVTTMCRRCQKGLSVCRPDRDHVHHILQRAGLGVNATVLVISGGAAALGAVAVVAAVTGVPEALMTLALVGLIYLHYQLLCAAWRVTRAVHRRLGRWQDGSE